MPILDSSENNSKRERRRGGRRSDKSKRERALSRFSAEVIGHIRDESRGTAVDPREAHVDVVEGSDADRYRSALPRTTEGQ